jgi:hypothetical protein
VLAAFGRAGLKYRIGCLRGVRASAQLRDQIGGRTSTP